MHLQRMRVILALTGFVEERHHTFSRTDLSNVVVDWDWKALKVNRLFVKSQKLSKTPKRMEEKTLRNHKSQDFSEVIQSDPTWCLSRRSPKILMEMVTKKSPSQKKSQTRRIARSVFFPWRIGFFQTTLQELLGALFVENDPRRPPFPQPGTDHTIPYFLQLGDASFKRKQLSSSRSTRWAQNNSLKWHRATINGKMNG